MPDFDFTSPDGKQYTITGPDGATADQAFQMLQQHLGVSSAPPLGQEIAGDVTNAIKSGAGAVADYLNPFSEARHASYAKQAQAPLGQALAENLSQIGGTGQALASPLTTLGGVVSGVTIPPVARVVQGLNQAAGIDLPYSEAKQQAETALMGIRPVGATPIGLRSAPAPALSAQELKAAAKSVYTSPEVKSINIPPQDVAGLAGKIENELVARGNRPTAGNAPGTFAEVQRMTPGDGVTSVGVDDIRSARRALQITAKQVDPTTFRATPDAEAAKFAIGHIDDFLDNISPNLRTANANYAAGKAAETLDYRNMRAERRAAKSGSGMNMENTMRQEVDKISNRGLTPAEIALRDKIVLGNASRNALRTAGKLGVDGGLSLALHAGAAYGSGGTSLPITAAGTLARKIGEFLTRGQIRALNEMIRSRAPASQSLPPVISPPPNPVAGLLGTQFTIPQLIGLGLLPARADQQQ